MGHEETKKGSLMISFIVIGRNEEKNLSRCLSSIFDCIKTDLIKKWEVIYIDSNSTDRSINIAKSFENISVFKLTEYYNAAIGRNIGFKYAKGDILFFIDGDMEISHGYLPQVMKDEKTLEYPFLSGIFTAINYDHKGNKISEKKYGLTDLNKEEYFYESGGIFLISREKWIQMNGMRNHFKKSQDVDLALRMAKSGTLILRKAININKHHTIPYQNKKRMWQNLFSKNFFYANGLLIRENILNNYLHKRLLKHNSTFMALVISIILAIAFQQILVLALHPILIAARVLLSKNKSIERMVYFFIRDYITLYSFLFFFPKQIKTENIPHDKC